jgi:hypothetical protein
LKNAYLSLFYEKLVPPDVFASSFVAHGPNDNINEMGREGGRRAKT